MEQNNKPTIENWNQADQMPNSADLDNPNMSSLNPEISVEKDEFDELTNSLGLQAAKPDPEFQRELKSTFVDMASYQQPSPSYSMWDMISGKWVLGASAFMVLVVCGVVFALRPNFATPVPQNTLTQQSKDVLRQVLTNNPQVVLNLQNATRPSEVVNVPKLPNNTTSSINSSQSGNPVIDEKELQEVKTFTYSYNRNVVRLGGAADKCSVFTQLDTGIIETYEYNDGETTRSKTIIYGTDEQIQEYYLIDEDGYTHFRNGKFAARVNLPESSQKSNQSSGQNSNLSSGSTNSISANSLNGSSTASTTTSASNPTSSASAQSNTMPNTNATSVGQSTSVTSASATSAGNISITSSIDMIKSEQLAVDFFGQSTNVEKIDNSNGKYYQITTTQNVDCGAGTSKILTVIKADYDTFAVFAEYKYLDSVSEAKLIRQIEIEQDTRNVDYADVSSIFQFDYAVPVRVFEVGKRELLDSELLISNLQNENMSILWPENGNATLTSLIWGPEVPRDGFGYFSERSFYQKGEDGDKAHKQYVDSLKTQFADTNNSIIQMEFKPRGSISTQNLTLTGIEYAKDATELIANLKQSGWTADSNPIVLSFTESRIEGTRLLRPARTSTSTSMSSTATAKSEQVIVFNWNGINYTLEGVDAAVASIQFEALDPSLPRTQQKLTEAMSKIKLSLESELFLPPQ